MSNTIKYSESTEQRALNKGNWWIGTGDTNKGPSDVTGYYAGVTPPSSGYTIYTKREDNLPSIFVAQNDQELLSLGSKVIGLIKNFAKPLNQWVVRRSVITEITDGSITPPFEGAKVWSCVVNTSLYGNTLHRIWSDGSQNGIVGDLGQGFYRYYLWVRGKSTNTDSASISIDISDGKSASATIGKNENWVLLEVWDSSSGNYNASKFFDLGFSNTNGETFFISSIVIASSDTTDTNQLGVMSYNPGYIDYQQSIPSNFPTVDNLFTYITKCNNIMVVNRDYENIVTDGLILNLDASYVSSYPESGNIWYDLSGGGHNGTLINGVSFTGSGASKALSFDGTDDYVNIGTDPEYNNLSVISINIWLYEYSPRRSGLTGGNTMILSNSRDCCGTYYGFDLKSNLGRTYWVLWNGTQTDVRYNTVVGTDMWYNISLTYDGSVAKIYYNGQLVTTKNASNAMAGPATTTLRVGAMGLYPNYEYFGKMGCVQLYNRAITSTEVLQNYNAQKHRFGL